MSKIISFDRKQKVANLNNFIAQANTPDAIEEYKQAIKRLKDRGKLTGAEAKKLNTTLKIRRATLKH